jgi:hypothetical protein
MGSPRPRVPLAILEQPFKVSKTSIISSIMLFRYGIATPKGSRWRDPLSLAILELQEKGTIQMLYNKWWKNTGDVCTRQVTVLHYYMVLYYFIIFHIYSSANLSYFNVIYSALFHMPSPGFREDAGIERKTVTDMALTSEVIISRLQAYI